MLVTVYYDGRAEEFEAIIVEEAGLKPGQNITEDEIGRCWELDAALTVINAIIKEISNQARDSET